MRTMISENTFRRAVFANYIFLKKKRAAVTAVQSRTARVITNLEKTSVNEIIERFPRPVTGVIVPSKSIDSNC